MGEEMEVGCARPTGGPVGETAEASPEQAPTAAKEVSHMIRVGRKAPDFAAPAYQQVQAFQHVRNSKGKEANLFRLRSHRDS